MITWSTLRHNFFCQQLLFCLIIDQKKKLINPNGNEPPLVKIFYFLLKFCWADVVLYIYIVCVSAAGQEHVPSWVWVAAGIFNFLAYTLGESSPLQAMCVAFIVFSWAQGVNSS